MLAKPKEGYHHMEARCQRSDQDVQLTFCGFRKGKQEP